jgi:dystonin
LCALQKIRQEINQTNPELELVRRNGKNLLQICGEIDKPEVKKHILNIDHAWKKITALYAKGEENMFYTGMDQAMELHIEQQENLLKFLEGGENNFDDNLDPLFQLGKLLACSLQDGRSDVFVHFFDVYFF